ncbi:MAG: type IV pilus modification PilV family protein [Patescibacteria group bacterium]
MQILKSEPNSGQTLVEVLVAIGLTTLALVAILSIALSNLSMGGQSTERTIAVFLVREGLELTKNVRDSQWLNPNKVWPYGLEEGNWIIDASTYSLSSADNSDIVQCDNCQLYLTSNNFYVHSPAGNSPTIFKRMVTISAGDNLGDVCDNNCEKKIRSEVYWIEHNRPHQIILEVRLTNWQK